MADITASLRLRFFADTSPLKQALGTLRDTARVASGGSISNALGLDKSKSAFKLGADINQAAGAMEGFKARLDSLTRGPIDRFKEFELVMARVKARTDGITDGSFARLKAAAEQAGASTMFTATEAAEGLFELSGAGLSAEQQVNALVPTLRLAQSGQVSLADAAALSVNTMAQFGLSVKDLPMVNDVLNQAANASTISLANLGDTFKYVGPIASKAGLDLKAAGTYTALLGNAGIVGSSAGTALRAMLSRLATQSPRAKKALQEVGLSGKDAAAGLRDPIKFLRQLSDGFASKGMDDAKQLSILMRVFGDEAGPAVAALVDAGSKLGADGSTNFDRMAKTMDNFAGSTDRANAAIEATSSAKIDQFESSLEALSIQMGENFAPSLLQMQKDLAPVVEGFGNWVRENPRLVSTLGRVLILTSGVLAVLIPLTLGVGALVTSWGVLGPVIRGSLLPLRMFGALLSGTTITNGVSSIATLGTTWATTAGKMRVGVGIAAAAFAGWQLGTLLDDWTAKFFGLREATLSAWLAVEAGESKGFNEFVAGAADMVGWSGLADAARQNQQINETRTRVDQRGLPPQQTPPPVKVDVVVEDKRTVVKQTTGRNTPNTLRTGSN